MTTSAPSLDITLSPRSDPHFERRIFGPPGTGKTTALAQQISKAVETFGAEKVLVTSFTRSAAKELVCRNLPLGPGQVGTLHSHCWNALGQPQLAETSVEEWNRKNRSLAITPVQRNRVVDGEDHAENDHFASGDPLLREMNRLRGSLIPTCEWSRDVADFAKRWEAHKRSAGMVDFCDLIDLAVRDLAVAPGSPAAVFADEAQDLNPMQAALIRKWGGAAGSLVLAGDDDQTIYAFAGASPDSLIQPAIPNQNTFFLEQSFRVPSSVHALASDLIGRVSHRQQKTYRPRMDPGAVHRISATYKTPEYFLLKSAEEQLSRGKRVMFLATCSYMLKPLIQVLRKEGIPFHNPYRASAGFWNPLRLNSRVSVSARIRALLATFDHPDQTPRIWSVEEFKLWCAYLETTDLTVRGRAFGVAPTSEITWDVLDILFERPALISLKAALRAGEQALLRWWSQRLKAEFRATAAFPVAIGLNRRCSGLRETPNAIVGTIHSVKGGEADAVYLFPDLSVNGYEHYRQPGPKRDSVIRVFYVGASRARETLFIANPVNGHSIRL